MNRGRVSRKGSARGTLDVLGSCDTVGIGFGKCTRLERLMLLTSRGDDTTRLYYLLPIHEVE